MLMVLVCFVIIFSDFPLVATLTVISILLQSFPHRTLLIPAMSGEFIIKIDGEVEYQGRPVTIRKALFLLDEICIFLMFKNGKRYLLWRDSVSEIQYRHIIVLLKKEH